MRRATLGRVAVRDRSLVLRVGDGLRPGLFLALALGVEPRPRFGGCHAARSRSGRYTLLGHVAEMSLAITICWQSR